MMGILSDNEQSIKHEVICPQIKKESQFEEKSYNHDHCDEETMSPIFDDLKVIGIKERVMVGKRAFYEIECSNLDPSQPVMLAERYVRMFLTDHLNKFNQQSPMELDL